MSVCPFGVNAIPGNTRDFLGSTISTAFTNFVFLCWNKVFSSSSPLLSTSSFFFIMCDELRDKYMFLEVTRSPPSASLFGPRYVISGMERSFRPLPDSVGCETIRIGEVIEIRLSGIEGQDNSTLMKMALLHGALSREYEPMTTDVTKDSLILTPSKQLK